LSINKSAAEFGSSSKFQDNGRIFWRQGAKKPGYPLQFRGLAWRQSPEFRYYPLREDAL
jgi:hypothetical protein